MLVLGFAAYTQALVPGMYDQEACKCPKPGTEPQDPDEPPDRSLCYDPLCPPGYYLCCYQCDLVTCAGNMPMSLSRRGKMECIECQPGDYCEGCDLYAECPVKGITKDSLTGEDKMPKNPEYLVSNPGAKTVDDCMECTRDFEASYDRFTCEPSFRKSCDETYMRRCMASCTDVKTKCDKMKCSLYCAKQWSAECLARYVWICDYFMNPPPVKLGVVSAPEEEGFAKVQSTTTTTTTTRPECDVVCSSVWIPSVMHIIILQLLFLLNGV